MVRFSNGISNATVHQIEKWGWGLPEGAFFCLEQSQGALSCRLEMSRRKSRAHCEKGLHRLPDQAVLVPVTGQCAAKQP